MISKTELNNCLIINFLEAFSYFEHLALLVFKSLRTLNFKVLETRQTLISRR